MFIRGPSQEGSIWHHFRRVGDGFVFRELGWRDPYSSAPAFDGWRGTSPDALTPMHAIVAPRTWLLAVGWRRGGLLDPDHCPGAMPS